MPRAAGPPGVKPGSMKGRWQRGRRRWSEWESVRSRLHNRIAFYLAAGYSLGMITAEEMAERMKREILADIGAGVVPDSVKDYSELHDYVDANCYGGSEELLEEFDEQFASTEEGHRMALDAVADLMNPAMEMINQWLAQRRLNR